MKEQLQLVLSLCALVTLLARGSHCHPLQETVAPAQEERSRGGPDLFSSVQDTHCYFLRRIDNGSGHHAVSLVSQSIFDDNNSMLDCGKLVMFCCRPKPSSKDTSPVQTGPLSINFPGS